MSLNNSYLEFLNNKALYYDKIDYDIIKKSWDILSNHITLPFVIHVIGTNGKGSTGRFLSSLLNQQDKKVLHYSSPHILEFNERIWINGSNSSDLQLNVAHQKIQELLTLEFLDKLTYFEYTTLMALYLSSGFDYIVLEAGLGGEFDATNVVKNDLSIITTIDLDHQEFLGNTIDEIASTKMRSCDSAFILGNQINKEVLETKKRILSEKKEINLNTYPLTQEAKELPVYLQNNLNLALSVMDELGIYFSEYYLPKLFGRFQKIAPNIVVDVGHNPLAASVIVEEFQKEKKKVILIYNSYKDKDYKKILKILKPIIKEVQILECDDSRIENNSILTQEILNLSLNVKNLDIMRINKDDNYLVFGSFLVVESFLKGYNNL